MMRAVDRIGRGPSNKKANAVTTWRGPLQAATKKADVDCFLIGVGLDVIKQRATLATELHTPFHVRLPFFPPYHLLWASSGGRTGPTLPALMGRCRPSKHGHISNSQVVGRPWPRRCSLPPMNTPIAGDHHAVLRPPRLFFRARCGNCL